MASATTQTQDQVSLKLLVNKDTNKVLFAEAGKDFVDVLFSFLTFPLGTIARLVEKKSNMEPVTVGCLNKLYQSVRDLDKDCLRTEKNKEMLLQPTNSSQNYCSALKLNIDDTKPAKYFLCTDNEDILSDATLYLHTWTGKECWCENFYTFSVSLKDSARGGFVNDSARFVITDNLVVMPNSVQFTSLDLLQKLEINGASSVKELIVNVTKDKILDMLKCCLLSKTTLTDLFLQKKPYLDQSWRFFSCDVKKDFNIDIQINVKLVIRKTNGKVLYAQGEQDFADLLLSFLTLPLGGVVCLLGGNCSIGNIDALYKSIDNLDETKYLTSLEAKNRLVNPHSSTLFSLSSKLLPVDSEKCYYCFHQTVQYFESIINGKFFVTDEYRKHWGEKYYYEILDTESPRGSDEGYVKGPRAYMATDDLVLTPWSPISAFHLMNHLKIPLNDLTEKFVTIGVKECLSILKASLVSTSAITNGLCHLLTEVKEEIVKTEVKE